MAAGRRFRPAARIIAAGLAVAACSGDGGPTPRGTDAESGQVAVVDAEGRSVILGSSPERILSLVPSATETLLDLGVGERLVGRTEYDTASALRSLPSVGGGLHPALESVLALRPDFVVRFAGETDRETPDRLDEVGVPHLAVAPESVEDTKEMIEELGRIVRRRQRADSLLAAIESALAEVRARVSGREPIRVAWVVGGDPPWVAGGGNYIDELIGLAGGLNVFHDLERHWAGVSPETLVARHPELILTVVGSRVDPRITRGARVRTVSAAASLPGPDLPRAALEIARAIHPELYDRP